ncbi:MAG: P22 phage major capsid protein family protein, partial [Candidatus Thorarchaeota archaeon]
LKLDPGNDAVITDVISASHQTNVAWHRDAIAFATRPLEQSRAAVIPPQSAVDPISGLTLRLEITREHKRDRFSFDILYGANVVRRDFGVRLAG